MEMKKTREWEQWDTQFRADVTTQGLSNVLDPSYIPATYDEKCFFESSNTTCMLSSSVSSRWIKGRLLFENTRVPSTPRVFTVNSRSTPRSLPKPSLMPTPFSSTSPPPVSVMEPGMARRRFNFMKNLLTPPLLCPTPSS